MIRLALLTIGFVSATVALLWTQIAPPDKQASALDDTAEEVTRAFPDTLGLQPALSILSPGTETDLARPATRPLPQAQTSALASVSRSLRPRARPAHLAALSTAAPSQVIGRTAPIPALVLESSTDKGVDIVRSMSLGIVQEMQKPVSPRALPKTTIVTPAPIVPAQPTVAVPTVAAKGRSYTVQPGDSLPGIAFRFYGTTVAYLEILRANEASLSDPSQLRAGMVLTIPDLN